MLTLLTAACLGAPADPVHLSDLLDEALRRNPEVQASEARARAARLAVGPAGALDDPMLMVRLWNVPLDGSMLPLMVDLSQALPLGGKRDARTAEAEAEARLAEAEADVKRRDVEAAVVKAYLDLFGAEQALQVNAEVRGNLEALRDVALARAAGALGEQVDVLRAETELVELEGQVEVARAQQVAAQAELAALLDRPSDAALRTAGFPGFLPPLPPVATLVERAARARPELAAAEAGVARAAARVRTAEAEAVPDVTPTLGYMRDFGGRGERNFVTLGLQGNLPVHGSDRVGPRRDAARAEREGLERGVHGLRRKIEAEVRIRHAETEAQRRAIEVHHRLIPLAREAVKSAMASYSSGRANFLVVLDSQRNLRTHQLDLARHLATYEQRAAELERAVAADLGLRGAVEAGAPHPHDGAPSAGGAP
jgi:outer membrane protein TolC